MQIDKFTAVRATLNSLRILRNVAWETGLMPKDVEFEYQNMQPRKIESGDEWAETAVRQRLLTMIEHEGRDDIADLILEKAPGAKSWLASRGIWPVIEAYLESAK